MIYLKNNSFPVSLPISDLTPFQQTIAQQLSQSRETYIYDTLDQLRFECRLREQLVVNSVALFESGVRYAVFEYSECNPRFWRRTPNGGFKQRLFVRSSQAISDIYLNGPLYAFECATAMVIILYKAVLDTIGIELFDRLFQDLFLFSWETDRNLGLRTYSTRDQILGDIVYFKNPQVNPLTPEWQGENAVVLSTDQYYGHGIGIRSSDEIIAVLNAQRRPGATQSAYLMNEKTRPDFLYLSQFQNARQIGIGKIGNRVYRWSSG